jgi:hypothetical protein
MLRNPESRRVMAFLPSNRKLCDLIADGLAAIPNLVQYRRLGRDGGVGVKTGICEADRCPAGLDHHPEPFGHIGEMKLHYRAAIGRKLRRIEATVRPPHQQQGITLVSGRVTKQPLGEHRSRPAGYSSSDVIEFS